MTPGTLRSPSGRPSLGLVLPTFPQEGGAPWLDMTGWAARAEAAGAEALWACDHLFWEGPNLECLTAMAFAAAGTSRCAVGSAVLQLPLRPAAAVAKAASSLQVLSGGRLVLGVGLGQHEGEYRASSADYQRRPHALEEGIDALRRHWSQSHDRYAQRPVPDHIPVWVGGSSARARRRAARVGNGWLPLFIPAAKLSGQYRLLDAEAEAAARAASEIMHALMVFVSVEQDRSEALLRGTRWMSSLYGLPADRFARHLVAGDPRYCAEALARSGEAGAEHLALFVTADDPLAQFESLMEAMAAVPA